MNYPRFPDDPCDGYHPGEEQPAMHNDEPQKPVTIPASDGLGAIRLRFFRDLVESERVKVYNVFGVLPADFDERLNHGIEAKLFRALIARIAADGAVEPDVAALVEKLSSAKANGDPNKYIAFVTVAEAHQAAAALTALQHRAETLERELTEARLDFTNDPGLTEGYKGDRTLTEWQTDAVMRVLSSFPFLADGTGWRPISTAPKDGTEILLYGRCERDGRYYAADRNVGWWQADDECWQARDLPIDPMHWQPLPAAPIKAEG